MPGAEDEIAQLKGVMKHDHAPNLRRPLGTTPHKEMPVDVDNLKLQLRDLESRFNPDYQYSDDHKVWVRQQAIADQISKLKTLIRQSQGKGTFENMTESIEQSLLKRIAEGLVRIEDILEGNEVYGGINDTDRKAIKDAFYDAMGRGWQYDDIVESLVEGVKIEVNLREASIGTIGTIPKIPTVPKPASTAPQTPQAITQVPPAANVQISGTPVQNTPVDPKELEKAIDQKLRDPNVNKEFSQLLAKVMQK